MGLSLISVDNTGTEEACNFNTVPEHLLGHMGADFQSLLESIGSLLTARGRLFHFDHTLRFIDILSAIARLTKTQSPANHEIRLFPAPQSILPRRSAKSQVLKQLQTDLLRKRFWIGITN